MSKPEPCSSEPLPVCPQITRRPPASLRPFLHKPIMRNLHWTQTRNLVGSACLLGIASFAACTYFVSTPRIEKYKNFHATAEIDEWAEIMAKKNLFQATPPSSGREDFPHMTYRPF